MTRLTLIRHGPTAWNAEKRAQGRSDIPLSAEGRAEVASWRAPAEIADDALYASPLRRARETAAILFDAAAQVEPRLTEMAWGAWEGRTIPELRATLGPAMAENEARGLDFTPEGGESPRQVLARVRPWIEEIAQGGRDATAVTHLGVIRVVMAAAFDWNMLGKPPVKIQPATAHQFDIAPGTITVRRMNVSLVPNRT